MTFVLLIIRTLTFRKRSFSLNLESHVFFAFLVFFVIGVAFNHQIINTPLYLASSLTILGYIGFIFGYKIASSIKQALFLKLESIEYRSPTKICFILCLLYVSTNLIDVLLRFPNPKDMINYWLSNPAGEHLYLVGSGEVRMIGSVTGHIQLFLFSTFLICWAIIFQRRKYFAFLIWFLFLYSQLGQYRGRSELLHYIAIPFYLCIMFISNKGKNKKIFIIASLAIFSLVFLSFAGPVRGEGDIYKFIHFPREQILYTISEVTSPIANALNLYAYGYRGSALEYMKILMTLPIPRFIWSEKPLFRFNIYISELIHRHSITSGYAIFTYTFYGEALYYFGIIGPLIIMFIFALLTRLTERLICSNKLFIGLYPTFLIVSMITIRSLFATEAVFIIQNIAFLLFYIYLLPKVKKVN